MKTNPKNIYEFDQVEKIKNGPGIYKIKLLSGKSNTNWMDITYEQLVKIQRILSK